MFVVDRGKREFVCDSSASRTGVRKVHAVGDVDMVDRQRTASSNAARFSVRSCVVGVLHYTVRDSFEQRLHSTALD